MVKRRASQGAFAGMRHLLACGLVLLPLAAVAQERPAQQTDGQSDWTKLPRMQLERQFAGPLRDTVVQRWRDPIDGTVCYIYLPISAPSTGPTPPGYVQYGPNTIGSLSCVHIPSTPAAPAKR